MDGNMCDNLIKWFQVLNIQAPHNNGKELSDGVAMAQALHQIAPETFPLGWLSKMKIGAEDNWRLKSSNLRKVLEGCFDYYNEILNLQLDNFPRPDYNKIAEKNDPIELGRLLQLILGCAVNCSKKQNYITQIMQLEESLQRNIMQTLQELDTISQGTTGLTSKMGVGGVGGNGTGAGSSVSIVNFDIENVKEQLAQRCYIAESQIRLLTEEKQTMQLEINKLQQSLRKYEDTTPLINDNLQSMGPIQPGTARYNELRQQMDKLKEELLLAETARDDTKLKSQQQHKEIQALQNRVEEYQQTNGQLDQLKDEIDALRESNDKLKNCEGLLQTYKKKFEDHNDLKKQYKLLEDQNMEQTQQLHKYEDDQKRMSTLKGQIELYKREIQELHTKLDMEMAKSVKIEFELNNLNDKLMVAQREKENLLSERVQLRETIDELRCGTNNPNGSDSESSSAVSRELLSPSLRDKLQRLEMENKALREGQGGQTALAQLLEDANQRSEKLREQLKISNQKILTLKQLQQQNNTTDENGQMKGSGGLVIQLKQSLELNEQRAIQIDDAQTQIGQLNSKVSQMDAALTAREQELQSADVRYRKLVDKAKDVIKTLDPRAAHEATIIDKQSTQNENDDRSNANITTETTRPAMGPVEEHLITTAFYRLGLQCQRDAVDSRIALLSSGNGQSFLNRQRQSSAAAAATTAAAATSTSSTTTNRIKPNTVVNNTTGITFKAK